MKARFLLCLAGLVLDLAASPRTASAEIQPLYAVEFGATPLGKLPPGWIDHGIPHSSPNWGVDGRGFLRVLWKGERGRLVYQGFFGDGKPGETFRDGTIAAAFKKTPEEEVSFGLLGRWQDARHCCAVRFSGQNRLQLLKIREGGETLLDSLVTRNRMPEGAVWTLSLTCAGEHLTGAVHDEGGVLQARIDALDPGGPGHGGTGLEASNFAAARSFSVVPAQPCVPMLTSAQIEEKNARAQGHALPDRVLRGLEPLGGQDTAFDQLAGAYDVIVAGAGTGGWAAAVQAARLGASVLLLEETDWIGGQMAAAAVASMDEEGCWEKFPVRERGLYREFHQSMVNHYYTREKDPFRAYYAWPAQLEGGYEPKIARAVLLAFLADARRHARLDLSLRTRVAEVRKQGDTVTGVTVQHRGETGAAAHRTIESKVLVEATEYGDVLPLAGARYRVGCCTSDALVPGSPVQYHTWVGVIREYPEGVPDHLRMAAPPPGYDARKFKNSQLWGHQVWGSAGKDVKGPRTYRVLLAWRGMADTESPLTGKASELRHTQCGLNGGRQDYPVTVANIENPEARRAGEREGIERTLCEIYHLQHHLGLPWAVAEDEGYDTPQHRRFLDALGLREDLKAIARHLPQHPYVREARRACGVLTLRAGDLTRFERARHLPTAVAMGDYFMDLDHGPTGHAIEEDLDSGEIPRGGGPFQIPFEVFIPEKLDGLVLAEKNLSQSRLVNGATRLQPVTMLTGQAAGAIAALSARANLPPRQLNPLQVQAALLEAGSNLIQRWYEDVPWCTPLWQATQLLALHGVMDAPGDFVKGAEAPLGAGRRWNPESEITRQDGDAALRRLAELAHGPWEGSRAEGPLTWEEVTSLLSRIDPARPQRDHPGLGAVKRGEFALEAAAVLLRAGRPDLTRDPR